MAESVKLDTFVINMQIALWGYATGESGAIQALYLKVLPQRNFVAEFHRENVSFTSIKQRIQSGFWATLLGGLGVTYVIRL